MKKSKIEIQYGVKSCAECEQNIRCNECVYNKQSIEYWQKKAVEKFADNLIIECAEHKNYNIDIIALNHLIEMYMGKNFPKTH